MLVRELKQAQGIIIGSVALLLFLLLGFSVGAQNRLEVPLIYPTIQEAYIAAEPGDTIAVDAGTYDIDLEIEKSVVLIGANFGIPANSSRNPETVIQGVDQRAVFRINCVCDVTIDGLTILPGNRFALLAESGLQNIFFRNNRIIGTNNVAGGCVSIFGSSGFSASDNLFRKTTQKDSATVNIVNTVNVFLVRNTIDSCYAGIRLDGVQASDQSNLLRYNTLKNLQSFGILVVDSVRATQNLLITENLVERVNNHRFSDIGGITIDGRRNRGFNQVIIRNNIINIAFNGIATRIASNLTGDDILFRYNALSNHTNAGFYHGGTGLLDVAGNWWNDRLGPVDVANPSARNGLRIRALNDETVAYSPWIYRFTDSASDTVGLQLQRPTTYGVRKTFPKTALPQSGNNIASRNDTLLFLDAVYGDEDVRFTKDIVISSKASASRPTLRDVTIGEDVDLKNLTVVGNFNARNVTLNAIGNGGKIFVRDTLFFSENLREDSIRHIVGTVQTVRQTGSDAHNFGNIGLEFGAGKDNLGTVTVTRKTGPGAEQNTDGLPSMQIYFRLQTTGANLANGKETTFRFFKAFNNGIAPADVVLWRRTDPKQDWKAGTQTGALTDAEPQQWIETINGRGEFTFSAPPRCKDLTAYAGNDTAACIGNLLFLSGRHSGGNGVVTYLWQPNTYLSDPTLPNPTLRPDNTITYTLTVTDELGCSSSDVVNVTPLKKPIINAGRSLNLCKGQTGQLNATGGIAYIWEPSTGLSDPYVPNPFVNVTQNTQYTLIGFGGNGCADTVVVNVFINESPIFERRQADVNLCQNDSIGLQVRARGTDAPNLRYEWSPKTGLSNFTSPFTVAKPQKTTIYTVTVTNDYGCKSYDTVLVYVQPTPKAYAGEDQTICAGTRIQLRGTGGKTYLWGPTQTMTDHTTDGPYASPLVTTTYSLLVTDSLGCTATDQVTITVLPNPQANAEGSSNVCAGETVRLNGFGGNTYFWSPPDFLDDPTAQNPLARPTQTTTFTLQVTDENGCNGLTFITVTVNPKPEALTNGDQNICLGETVTLQASGGIKYLWEPAIYLDNPEIATPRATPDVQTTYTVTVFNEQNCASKALVTVFVNPIPLAFAGYDQIICPGGKAQLLAIQGTHYAWQPATGLSDANIANPVATPQVTTTYTLTVQGEFGCTAVDSVTIIVLRNDEPLVRPAGNVFICNGGYQMLETFYRGDASYQWYKDGRKIEGALNINYSAGLPGRYQVEVTLNGCAVLSDEVIVTEGGTPLVDAGENTSICLSGTGVQMKATGGVKYQWMPAEGLSNDMIPNPIANPKVTTTYTVYVQDAGGCVGKDSVTVAVAISPNVMVYAEKDPTICFGERLRLSTREVPFTRYRWLRDGQPLPQTNSDVFYATLSGTYTCEVTLAGCEAVTSSNAILVTILAPPTADAGSDMYICTAGNGVKLQGRGDGPRGVQFRWEPNIGLSNTAIADPIALPSQTTTYTLTVVDGRGCRASDEVTVYVAPMAILVPPRIMPAGDVKLCSGDTAYLEVPYTEGVKYQWIKNGIDLAGATATSIQVTESGTYRVAVYSEGCPRQLSAIKSVLVNERPFVSATVKDASCPTCFNGEIRLTISGGTAPYTVFSQAIPPTDKTHLTELQYGTYDLTVEDAVGCQVNIRAIVRPYPVGVDDNFCIPEFNVYPNPSNGIFVIDYPQNVITTVEVLSLTGQTIYRQELSIESTQTTLNLRNQAAGIYILRLRNDKGDVKAVQKIIIE